MQNELFAKVYSNLNLTIYNSWDNSHPSNQRFVGSSHARTKEFYNKVGAACYISLSNSSGYYILINESGDELMQYRSAPSRVMAGPWVIN